MVSSVPANAPVSSVLATSPASSAPSSVSAVTATSPVSELPTASEAAAHRMAPVSVAVAGQTLARATWLMAATQV